MLRDDAVAQIKFWLNAAEELEDAIIRELKLAQIALEKRSPLPWFLLTEEASVPLTPDEERVPVPEDFIREYDAEGAMWRNIDGKLHPIYKAQRGLYHFYPQNQEITPPESYYSLDGEYFRIYPVPTTEDTIGMLYYAKAAVLDTNIENAWLKHAPELLMTKAGMQMAMVLRNGQALQGLTNRYFEANRTLDLAIVAREEARRTHVNFESLP